MERRLFDLRYMYSLRRYQVNSISVAFDKVLDPAIVGINAQTGSIIYDCFKLFDLLIENPDEYEKYTQFHSQEDMTEYFDNLVNSLFEGEQVENQVLPTHLLELSGSDIAESLFDK